MAISWQRHIHHRRRRIQPPCMSAVMGPRSPNITDLILAIHTVALAEDGWGRIGDDLCRALCADGAALAKPAGKAVFKPWCRLFEFDAAFIRGYADHWGRQDVWYEGAVRTRRTGVGLVNLDRQLIDRRDFEKTAFYHEYLRPMGIDGMMNVCLSKPEADGSYGPTAMSFYRRPGKDSFSSEEAGLLSQLAPHLAVAAQNFWAAQSLRLLSDAYRTAVDTVTSAVFGTESTGRVTFANRAGEELLRQTRWVQILQGVLHPAKAVIEATSLIKSLHHLSSGVSFRCIVTERLTDAQAIISGAPILPSTANPLALGATALVWITPITHDIDTAADLAALFELTPAEKRLVAQLIAGDDLRDAAAKLHISPHTARTQLKAVFRKTGRRTQSALLTLAEKLAVLRTPPR